MFLMFSYHFDVLMSKIIFCHTFLLSYCQRNNPTLTLCFICKNYFEFLFNIQLKIKGLRLNLG